MPKIYFVPMNKVVVKSAEKPVYKYPTTEKESDEIKSNIEKYWPYWPYYYYMQKSSEQKLDGTVETKKWFPWYGPYYFLPKPDVDFMSKPETIESDETKKFWPFFPYFLPKPDVDFMSKPENIGSDETKKFWPYDPCFLPKPDDQNIEKWWQYGPYGPYGPYYMQKKIDESPVTPKKVTKSTVNISDFFALIPSDNPSPIAPGNPIAFPQTNVQIGNIVRSSANQFILPEIGTYEINYQVITNEPCQLVVSLNNNELPNTIIGKSNNSELCGTFLITTTRIDSVICLNNSKTSSTNITLTPSAGGNSQTSAHLIIKQII